MILLAVVALVLAWYCHHENVFGCQHRASVRTIIGGFRCPDCGKIGDSLDEMGYPFGYISRANPLLQRTR
jgi:hypothetical protein